MPEEYLRVEPSAAFGLVGRGKILILNAGGRESRLVASTACERVLIWDTITKEVVRGTLCLYVSDLIKRCERAKIYNAA